MAKVSIELSEKDMLHMAEMAAMVLCMMGQCMGESKDRRVDAWQKLCVSLLKQARGVPSIGRNMEMNPDCGYWFFKRPYIDTAFYSDVLDEFRDYTFWNELVTRMAEHALVEVYGAERGDNMPDSERAERTSSLEKSLWTEVTKHGIDRMAFLMPPEEA